MRERSGASLDDARRQAEDEFAAMMDLGVGAVPEGLASEIVVYDTGFDAAWLFAVSAVVDRARNDRTDDPSDVSLLRDIRQELEACENPTGNTYVAGSECVL